MPHRLLLADDSVTIQRVIELTFADEEVEVVAVGDGDLAVARLEAEPFDIVLADVGMPKRDGYSVAEYVRTTPRLAGLPVLLLTGAFEPVDEARARGCAGVLAKPFEPQQVIARVRELLAGRPPAKAAGGAIPLPPPAPEVGAAAPHVVEPTPSVQAAEPVSAPAAEPRASDAASEPAANIHLVPSPEQRALDVPLVRPGRESVDDYFERLDAAFATLNVPLEPRETRVGPANGPAHYRGGLSPSAAAPGAPPEESSPSVASPVLSPSQPTPAEVAPVVEPPADRPEAGAGTHMPPGGSQLPRGGPSPSGPAEGGQSPSGMADAFHSLLAVERGEPMPALPALEVALTDDLVDRVARRVAEQLGDRAVRELATDIVSRTAERLVKEEIERLKQQTD